MRGRLLPGAIALVCAGIAAGRFMDGNVLARADDVRGRDASPDYRRVFAQDSVGRLDLRITPADWQAVLRDMEAIAGPPGQGGPQGGPDGPGGPGGAGPGGATETSPDAIAACAGRLAGEACSVGSPPVNGRCTLSMAGPPLACQALREPPVDGNRGGADVDPGELFSQNPIYVAAQVTFDGETFPNVGFRLKGNAGLMGTWRQGKGKLPFRLNLDALEGRIPEVRDQTFFGFPNLTFQNGAQDNSYLRYKVIMGLFLEAGLPAPQTAFTRVYLDRGDGPVYLGLYTMVEIPDRPMLEHFFQSDDGNLYKPSGTGARWTVFDRESFAKRTNEEDEDWTDVTGAIAALQASRQDAARWRFGLEARFDVNGFLRWLALNTIVGNGDAYGGLAHNYYLYGSPRHRDRLFWIPWDPELGLRSAGSAPGGGPGGGAAAGAPGGGPGGGPGGAPGGPGGGPALGGGPDGSLDLFHDSAAANWPLIRYLMDDPVYRAVYRGHVEDLIATVFEPSKVKATIRSEHARIAPYVVGSEPEDPRLGFAGTAQTFDDTVHGTNGLLAIVDGRVAAVRRALEIAR